MKTVFIEAKSKIKVELPKELIRKLPKKLALFTTIQYHHNLPRIKKQLAAAGKHALLLRTKHCKPGQLLGCSIHEFKQNFEAFLYIGDGKFHPKALLYYNKKPVYTYNPRSRKLSKLENKEIEKIKKSTRGALLKFLSSKYIGFLISTKPGQTNIQATIKQLEAFEKKYSDKKFYYFISNEINNLEDFPFIEVFINTACPRLALDDQVSFRKPIINIKDI